MYVKLNFTADKQLNTIFRIADQIINNSGITSIATLSSTATSNSWWSGLLSNLDTANSEIIRTGTGNTALTSNTKSKYVKTASETYTDSHEWTVEFSTYDAPSTKYYVQHYGAGANTLVSAGRVGVSISGSMTTGATPVTGTDTATGSAGTPVGLNTTGTALSSSVNMAYSATGFTNVRTFIMYITDKCMIWATTNTATYNSGFGGTYSNSANYCGPWIYSQYTRFDYHNTNANGIIPLAFTNFTIANGQGFGGATNYWNATENVLASSQATQTLRVMNCVNAYPTTGASFPIVVTPTVNWGIGSRYSDTAALNASSAGAVGTVTAVTYGAAIFNTVSTRYPSADLKTQTFGMLPMTWRHLNYYNAGGDISAQGNFYVFNGDYFPGDEYSYGGKTYKIIPTFIGYSQRVGIAIPKE